jgi:aryl-alcohol dehydrogenase-like predicted oxidoreductase
MLEKETPPMTSQPRLKLGNAGPEVCALGLGTMGMSGVYGAVDDELSIAVIQAAIERGIDLIDTGDFYGMGHNEMLIARAIRDRRDKVKLSVKFGALRGPDNSWGGVDARPQAVKNFAAYSLKRLGVEVIDVYRPARLDPQVPIEDTVGAIAQLIEKGYVRQIGLSEVGVETIRRAHAVHPIADLQIEYSLVSRGPEQKIFPALRELGIGATLYGVLSRGLLGGSQTGDKTDIRNLMPRFSKDNLPQNQKAVEALQRFAAERGMSAAQVALAWVRAKQPDFVALIGARTQAQLDGAIAALARPLTAAEVAELEQLVPPDALAGSRYAPEAMRALDSER